MDELWIMLPSRHEGQVLAAAAPRCRCTTTAHSSNHIAPLTCTAAQPNYIALLLCCNKRKLATGTSNGQNGSNLFELPCQKES